MNLQASQDDSLPAGNKSGTKQGNGPFNEAGPNQPGEWHVPAAKVCSSVYAAGRQNSREGLCDLFPAHSNLRSSVLMGCGRCPCISVCAHLHTASGELVRGYLEKCLGCDLSIFRACSDSLAIGLATPQESWLEGSMPAGMPQCVSEQECGQCKHKMCFMEIHGCPCRHSCACSAWLLQCNSMPHCNSCSPRPGPQTRSTMLLLLQLPAPPPVLLTCTRRSACHSQLQHL